MGREVSVDMQSQFDIAKHCVSDEGGTRNILKVINVMTKSIHSRALIPGDDFAAFMAEFQFVGR